MTPEENKTAIKYWQYRKAKARKIIKQNALVGCSMFQTCVPEMNKSFEKNAKEKIEWANREIKFADKNIKKLKKVV